MSFGLVAKYLAWAVVLVVALVRPTIGDEGIRRLERLAGRLARHRTTTWMGMGVLVLLVRGALLPLWPIPKPVIYDEFSYILGADTFAHGRLTNPTHKLWPFFESAYVLQHPTYASKYPPAQALAMALGQVMLGDPWFGVWLSAAAMMAALVWALQGWLPPGWAMLGGFMAIPVALLGYWMNSYWGGAVAGIGGALLLGGYVRVVKQKKIVYALAMGVGIALLANTRPYEGLVFCIPIAIAFLMSRPRIAAIGLLAVVLVPAFVATGYYNYAVTGSAFNMPFTEYARQYAHIPLFNFQPMLPTKVYRTQVIYDLHQNWEPGEWQKARSLQLISIRLTDWRTLAVQLFGGMLIVLPLVLFAPNLFKDRRIRLPLVCVAAALAGSLLEVKYYAHYAGPITAAVFIVAVQSMRHLRQWKLREAPAGRVLARALPLLLVGVAAASQGNTILHQERPEDYQPINARRGDLVRWLEDQGGKHVILVHYTGNQSPHEEWVYNGADIDSQDVIWAHDLGVVENAQIVNYYKDRKIWWLQPDIKYDSLDPYASAPH